MTMKHGGTYILVFIFSIFTCALSAQVNIKAGVSRDKILIGETVSLTIDAYVPIGAEVSWFPSDSIEHFEVIKRSPADTVANIDGKKITQVLTITSFDSGRWTIPPFEVTVGGKPYYSDSLSIDVAFISFDPREDYHDIKDIIVVEDPALKYIPWIIFAVSLVSLALLVFLCRRMTKVPVRFVKNNITSISAYEEAMNALEELKKKGAPDGNEKIYYTEMNDILRKYVSGKFGISTFERTNEELILQLTAMNLPQKPFSSLIQSLRMSDFVKFAKYRPSEEDNIHNLDIVRSSIDLLNNYSGSAV
jgi:hypothetical protein